MKKISSSFTYVYKGICFLKGSLFLLVSLLFLFEDFIIFIILFSFGCFFLFISKKIKHISLGKETIYVKGFFSRKEIPNENVIKVGNIFLFFYLKTKKGRVLFMNTFQSQIKAFINSDTAVQDDILKKIKGEE